MIDMTPDSITSAARTEAAYRDLDPSRTGQNNRAWFVAGAEWQASQEPDPAGLHELDESAPVRNLGYYRSSARCKCGYEVIWGEHEGDAGLAEAWRVHTMRSAVHAARRNEENR